MSSWDKVVREHKAMQNKGVRYLIFNSLSGKYLDNRFYSLTEAAKYMETQNLNTDIFSVVAY